MTRFIAYLRVSTARQGASGLGIETQRAAVAQHIASAGGQIVAEVVEAESGKRSHRPELARAIAACRAHRATLLIAKLDWLARNVAFIAGDLLPVIANVPAASITTLPRIAAALTARGVPTPSGRGAWSPASVMRLQRRVQHGADSLSTSR